MSRIHNMFFRHPAMKIRKISQCLLLCICMEISMICPVRANETEVSPTPAAEEGHTTQSEKTSGPETSGLETSGPEISAPGGFLIELSTGKILFEKNSEERRSPASITKIMTLLLIFRELEKGTLTLEEEVVTSAHAKSMGGSQVFLEEGEKQTVETLIKCIVVASGNDASVAMAEHIAGTEEEFVHRMNQEAEKLGMKNTHFVDCCGLTESRDHYSTPKDVGIMSRELVGKYPKILEYSSIWMENITHVTRQGSKEFCLSNTNKLIRGMDGCRGLKTGSTSLAKFCVSAVAERNGITLISVIMGAPQSKGRFKDAAALLNYGFSSCRLYVDENKQKLPAAPLEGGVEDQVSAVYQEEFHYIDTEGQNLEKIRKENRFDQNLKAPVKKGQEIGKAVYLLDDKEIGSVKLLAGQNVDKADFMDYLIRSGKKFLLCKEG